jgi:hypothetical protein
MIIYWFLPAIAIGIPLAFAGLITILVRRSFATRGIGPFTCFGIVLVAVFITKTAAAMWVHAELPCQTPKTHFQTEALACRAHTRQVSVIPARMTA